MRRKLRRLYRNSRVHVYVAVAVVVAGLNGAAFVVGRSLSQTDSKTTEVRRVARENRDLACAISRLVSFVPAVQFEGESLENFIGWVEARRDMLALARGHGQCSRRTITLLAVRVKMDEDLLKELREQDDRP